MSERGVLGLLFRRGQASQAELAHAFGLTQQSISRVASRLGAAGMVAPGDRVGGSKGYPTTTIRLRGEHCLSLGLSVSAGTAELVAMDFAGATKLSAKLHDARMAVDAVGEWVAQTAACWTERTHLPPVGLGVGVAGSFTAEKTFNTPPYLEDWIVSDLRERLATAAGLPVWLENDGNAAAVAESILGVGRWAPNFAYLFLSAGVGGGIVLDGQVWRGRAGNAGEFAGGLPPNIYPFPNLELLRLIVGREGVVFQTVDELVASYDPAWRAIDDWIHRVRDSVSIIASNATAILDLDAIVIGGLTPPDLARRLAARVDLYDQKRRSVARPVAKLVPGEVGAQAAAVGAAMLPLQARFFRPPRSDAFAPPSGPDRATA